MEWTVQHIRAGVPEVDQCIIRYKALYILNTDCNIVFGRLMLPFLKLVLMIFFATAFFAIIRFVRHLTLLSFSMVALIAWTSALMLVPTSIVMSSLYKISTRFRRNVPPYVSCLDETQFRKEVIKRQLIGCGVIRCQVGGLYYMEAKAKLTVIHKLMNGLKYLLVNIKA